MTTIAMRGGVIAADTMSVQGYHVFSTNYKKINTLPNGDILAYSGDVDYRPVVMESIISGDWSEIDSAKKIQYALILVRENKELGREEFWYRDKYSKRLMPIEQMSKPDSFFAIGSGRAYAYGALHNGATATQAIKAAMAYDVSTGGTVQWMRYEDKK